MLATVLPGICLSLLSCFFYLSRKKSVISTRQKILSTIWLLFTPLFDLFLWFTHYPLQLLWFFGDTKTGEEKLILIKRPFSSYKEYHSSEDKNNKDESAPQCFQNLSCINFSPMSSSNNKKSSSHPYFISRNTVMKGMLFTFVKFCFGTVIGFCLQCFFLSKIPGSSWREDVPIKTWMSLTFGIFSIAIINL